MKTWIPDKRNFAYLNWKQVDALARDQTLLVLPTAAIEQHGHHLPLATDTLINCLLLGRALEKLPAELAVYALPPLCYGKSNEHLGFPGTLSLSAGTFMAVVRDLGASLAGAGFRKLVLYNTHGGNTSLVDVLARDLRAEFGLQMFALHGSGGVSFTGLGAQERAYGFHAGEVETAFLLAAARELVDTSAYTVNYIADVSKPEVLLPENAAATFAWLTRDIAASGVMGDPRAATAENGERWIAEAAARLAQALQAMASYAPPRGATDPQARNTHE
ncbi:MAG: creatininase family protein [Candidatus Acidiferrum sp.]|jgi:creatinine amidohydrolase